MKTITTVLFLLFTTSIFSQNIKYKTNSSEVFSDRYRERGFDFRLIMEDEKYYYFDLLGYNNVYPQIMGNNIYHSILKITKNLKKRTRTRVTLDKNERAKGIYKLGDNMVVISRVDHRNTINIRSIIKTNFNIGKAKTLTSSITVHTYIWEYWVKQSKDKSKIAILYLHIDRTSDNISRKGLGLMLINEDMEVLWHNKDINLQFTGTYKHDDFFISNNGDVYLLGKILKTTDDKPATTKFKHKVPYGKNKYFIDNPDYKFQLNKFSDNGTLINYYNLNIPNYEIRNISIDIDNDKLFGYGIYRKSGSIDALGAFVSEIDINKGRLKMIDSELFNKKIITKGFSEEELNAYKDRERKQTVLDPFNYSLSEIKYKENGKKYFIAEQRLRGILNTSSYEEPVYIYNDIFIFDLNNKNIIKNINKISKRQYFTEPWYFSYSETCVDNTHYFIFNETKKLKKANCVLVGVNGDNEPNEIELVNYKKKKDLLFVPIKNSIQEPKTFLYTRVQYAYSSYYKFETLKIEE